MNMVTSMILRRIRAPFLLLISVYSFAIIGMILIPGVDDSGDIWHMSIFHAVYFVSFTATTIGFGEIPYPLSEGQRLWALLTIYVTVTAWFYALGKILSLIQDPIFREAVVKSRFKRNVESIRRPFYLICGFGETGNAVVSALTDEGLRTVVIEKKHANLHELKLNELREFVPSITGDASDPEQLKLAGIKHPMCRGVIAVTASDEINLKIAITSKLLHPDIRVACRSDYKAYEENMRSFGTDYIVNPYETFANIFSMSMHSPSLHLIYDWLTGAPNTKLSDPVYFRYGKWILCGYGRFGKKLFQQLRAYNIDTTIIDPSPDTEAEFRYDENNRNTTFIKGTGTDAETLIKAGIKKAAGLIAGSDNDSNNLSIIMTARGINPDVFVVARQNQLNNQELYTATQANLVMRPREIIARKIRVQYLSPLLIDYLHLAYQQEPEWANVAISRLSAIVGESRPHIWTVLINQSQAPAIAEALGYGRIITMEHLTQDPAARANALKCVPLLIARDNRQILMPEKEQEVKAFDRILFCGSRDVKNSMGWTLNVMSSLNYVMTLRKEPESYVWRKLYRHFHKVERRELPRQ